MAIIVKKGALGTLSGRVGNVVLSKWRGKDVARDTPGRRKNINEKPISRQSLRLGLVTHFLSPFSKYIKMGYPGKTSKKPGFHISTEYNLKHAVTGVWPHFKIDYKNANFSKGSLDMAWGAKMGLLGTASVRVIWEVPETSKMKVIGTDIACFLLYSEKSNSLVNLGTEKYYRADLGFEASFANHYHGEVLHGWLFFVSADGKSASNTRYIGAVDIPEKKVVKAVADLHPSTA